MGVKVMGVFDGFANCTLILALPPGAMTVFERSRAEVSRCTFTGNWAGVDDNGTGSTYVNSIFWNNTLKGGISTGARYEIDITSGGGVRESFIHGETKFLEWSHFELSSQSTCWT